MNCVIYFSVCNFVAFLPLLEKIICCDSFQIYSCVNFGFMYSISRIFLCFRFQFHFNFDLILISMFHFFSFVFVNMFLIVCFKLWSTTDGICFMEFSFNIFTYDSKKFVHSIVFWLFHSYGFSYFVCTFQFCSVKFVCVLICIYLRSHSKLIVIVFLSKFNEAVEQV